MKKKLKYDKSIFHNNKQIIYRIFFFLKNEILLIKIYLFVRMKYNKIHYSNNYSNKIKFNFIFFFDIL